MDKIKEIFTKICDFIKKIWSKIVVVKDVYEEYYEDLNERFDQGKEELENIEDKIKKLKEEINEDLLKIKDVYEKIDKFFDFVNVLPFLDEKHLSTLKSIRKGMAKYYNDIQISMKYNMSVLDKVLGNIKYIDDIEDIGDLAKDALLQYNSCKEALEKHTPQELKEKLKSDFEMMLPGFIVEALGPYVEEAIDKE